MLSSLIIVAFSAIAGIYEIIREPDVKFYPVWIVTCIAGILSYFYNRKYGAEGFSYKGINALIVLLFLILSYNLPPYLRSGKLNLSILCFQILVLLVTGLYYLKRVRTKQK